ncbi:MAG TPA: hypothetical protein VL832_25345 [Puia sp.]|nr:hypothetical protein [Puia sp.]
MRKLLIFSLLAVAGYAVTVRAQVPAPETRPSSAPAAFPSPEEFINAVFHTVVDPSFVHYYLIKGADTCRFVKYDYDEWTKYYLQESVPMPILNELAEKAYLSRYPYFWRQDHLQQAVCITPQKADSVFTLANPALKTPSDVQDKMTRNQLRRQWQQLPVQEKTVFSFSLPQFTDDGKYAVIDLNVVCGARCGSGITCLFRHTSAGWKLIGRHTNWAS